MKKLLFVYLYICLSQANATTISNFTGDYDVSLWTTTGNGSVDISGAPLSILEISSDTGSGFAENTDFTIAALGPGTVAFHWDYETFDTGLPPDLPPFFDPFGYLLNGVFTQLSVDTGFDMQSGNTSFAVALGDVFGFRAFSLDSSFGPSQTTITNFSAPGAPLVPSVPEPTILALFGIGLAGFSISRKRHRG